MSISEDYVTNNDVNLVCGKKSFDGSTCSGDTVCDIFDNTKDIIT